MIVCYCGGTMDKNSSLPSIGDLKWLDHYLKSRNVSDQHNDDGDLSLHNLISGLHFEELHVTQLTFPIYGYVTPILCLIVIITNVLFITVFAKQQMNSPTHLVLKCIAVSDTLTILFPTPCFIYMYMLGNYKEYVPYTMCVTWDIFTTYFPTITHTASIWLTTLLAIQRYICVSYPLNVRMWCGIRRTYIFVAVIYICAAGCHFCRFFENKTIEVTVQSKLRPGVTMTSCNRLYNDFVTSQYLIVYSWVRAVVVNTIPCCAMVIFNTIMLVRLRRAEQRRKNLRRKSTLGPGQNDPRESRVTTWLVVFIVNNVIIVEMPIAAFFVHYAMSLTTRQTLFSPHTSESILIILNLCVRISYPLHFAMYCCMSTAFRKTLEQMLKINCNVCKTLCLKRKKTGNPLFSLSIMSNTGQTNISTVSNGSRPNVFSTC